MPAKSSPLPAPAPAAPATIGKRCPSCDQPLDSAGLCTGCGATIDLANGDAVDPGTIEGRIAALETRAWQAESRLGVIDTLLEGFGIRITPGAPATDSSEEVAPTVHLPDLGSLIEQFGGGLAQMLPQLSRNGAPPAETPAAAALPAAPAATPAPAKGKAKK